MRKLAVLLALLLVVIVAGTAVVRTQDSGPRARTYVESLVQRLLSAEGRPVEVEDVSIGLTGNVTVRRVAVRDERGEWLVIDDFALDWRPLSLFTSTLRVTALSARRLTVIRRPEAAPPAEAPKEAGGLTAAEIGRLAIEELRIEAPVAGVPATLTVTGSAAISQSPPAVSLELAARRTDEVDGRLVASIVYDRDSGELDLDLLLTEDSGGLVQRLLALADDPVVDLRLVGRGPVEAWTGDLRLSLNGRPVITGNARIAAVESGTMVEASLAGSFAELMPEALDAAFAGRSELAAAVILEEAGTLRIDSAILRSDAFEVTADGLFDPAAGDLVLSMTGQVGYAGPVAVADLEVLRLAFEARLQGQTSEPEWAFNATAESLAAAGLAAREATIEASGTGLPLSAGRRASANVLAAAVLGPTDGPALPPLVTGPVGLALGLDLPGDGRIVIERAELEAGAATATASGHFTPADGRYELAVDAAAPSPRTGHDLLDRLLAGRARLVGRVSGTLPGDIRFDDVSLTSDLMASRLTGSLQAEEVSVSASAAVHDLARLDRRMAGRVELVATLSGPRPAPRVVIKGGGREVRLMDKPFADVAFEGSGRLDAAAPSGEVRLTGTLDRRPVDIAANLAAADGGGPTLDLAATIGTARIAGVVAVPADAPPRGRLTVAAPDLSHLAPLLLAELAGSIDADIELAERAGASRAAIAASGRDIAYGAFAAHSLAADIVIDDLFGAPRPQGAASLRQARLGAFEFAAVDLTAATLADRSFAVAFEAAGRRLSLTARTRTAIEDGVFLVTAESLSGTLDGADLKLLAPAVLRLGAGTLAVGRAELAVGDGRLVIAGALSPGLDLDVEVRDLPLSLAAAALPDLAPAGRLSGAAVLSGSLDDPQATFRFTGREVSLAASRDYGLPPLALEAAGELAERRLVFNASASGPGATQLAVSGALDWPAVAQVDIAVRGMASSAIVADRLAEAGLRLDARLTLDLRLSGPPDALSVTGTVTTADATFGDIDGRFVVRQATARFVLADRLARIEQLEGATGRNGRASITGTVGLAAPHPADLSIAVERGYYSDGTLLATDFDARLTLTGPLTAMPLVAGRVELIGPKLTLNEPPPVALTAVEVMHVNPPPAVARQAAALTARQVSRGGAVELAVEIVVRDRFTIRGRGVNAELGGRLTLTGPLAEPRAIGSFRVRRGHIDLIGRRLDIDSGGLDFIGNLDPRIELIAVGRRDEFEIRLTVTGRATEPQVVVTSSPQLPQEEALARLVLGNSLTQMSPLQVAQLAAAVATLSGGGGGGLFEGLGQALGLDRFEVYQTDTGETMVAVGRRVSENVSLGVEQGTDPGSTRVTIDIDVTRNIKARGGLGRDGSTKAGLFFVFDY